jgi:uncharacterized RDD family membrane protein YckC
MLPTQLSEAQCPYSAARSVAAFYAARMESATAPESPRNRARIWRRALAFLLDGAALAALGFLVLFIASLLLGPGVRIELDGTQTPRVEAIGWRVVLNAILLAGLSAAYFVTFWIRILRTPGQAALGIAVEDAVHGAMPLPMSRALLRWALLGAPLGILAAATVNVPLAFLFVSAASAAWFAVLIITTLFSRSGRGLHDRASGSVVVRSGHR